MGEVGLPLAAALLVLLAGVFSAADAALASFSHARAEELLAEGRPGSRRLVALLEDSARNLNTALLLRMLCEIAATVLVTRWLHDLYDGAWWPTGLTAVARHAAAVLRGDRRRPPHPGPPARRAGRARLARCRWPS